MGVGAGGNASFYVSQKNHNFCLVIITIVLSVFVLYAAHDEGNLFKTKHFASKLNFFVLS